VETIVILSLGTNLGDKEKNLKLAIEKINQSIGSVLKISNFHISQPWGFKSEYQFLNCCCQIMSKLNPHQMLRQIKQIESSMGRQKSLQIGYEDRIIDIDIVLFGNQIVIESELIIPHPNFKKRDFVLKPLLEISNQIDPESFININQLNS